MFYVGPVQEQKAALVKGHWDVPRGERAIRL